MVILHGSCFEQVPVSHIKAVLQPGHSSFRPNPDGNPVCLFCIKRQFVSLFSTLGLVMKVELNKKNIDKKKPKCQCSLVVILFQFHCN